MSNFWSKYIMQVTNPKIIMAKGYSTNICFNKDFVFSRIFYNCAALLSEISTNSLRLEPRTKRCCKILIVTL